MATKKKSSFPGFTEYTVTARMLYRHGKCYRRGEKVVLPIDEQPVADLRNADGSKPKWDAKKGLVTNAIPTGNTPPPPTPDKMLDKARELATAKSRDDLMEMCYGLGLDPNGTKIDMAGRIIAKHTAGSAGTPVVDDDDVDDDFDDEDSEPIEAPAAT